MVLEVDDSLRDGTDMVSELEDIAVDSTYLNLIVVCFGVFNL